MDGAIFFPMAINATHPEYDAALAGWQRARNVIAGEDAVKAAGELYLPRLTAQSDDDYNAYRTRASFFNATSRTADGYVGMVFRRSPFQRLPSPKSSIGKALAGFSNDADMLGTSLYGYAKNVTTEVISVGRAGSLVDWEDTGEYRAYATMYAAESILNWRVERIHGRNIPTLIVLSETTQKSFSQCKAIGRNIPTLIVLSETVDAPASADASDFSTSSIEQIRVLRLVPLTHSTPRKSARPTEYGCVVEIYRRQQKKARQSKAEWSLFETRTPLRRGKPLPLLPFVFHGPRHSPPRWTSCPSRTSSA